MTKKVNDNDKILKVTDLYHSVDYHLNQTETVFNNPEKYGFVDVAIVNSNGIEMVTIQQEAIEYFIVGYTGVPKTLFGYDKIDKTTFLEVFVRKLLTYMKGYIKESIIILILCHLV